MSRHSVHRRVRRSSRMRRAIASAAIAAALAAGISSAETVSSDMNIPSAGNSLSLTVTANLNLAGSATDTKIATVSGDVMADFGMLFDPATQTVSSIDTMTLTGGRFGVSDVTFNLKFGLFGLLGTITAAGKGISGTFSTPNPPALVTLNTFNAADQQTTFDKGTITASGTGIVGGALNPNPTVFDLSTQPMSAPGSGTGTIAVGAPTVSNHIATYGITLSMPVNFDQQVYNDPTNGTVNFKAVGTLQATGTFSRATQYTWNTNGGGSWADSTNWDPAGVPNDIGVPVYLAAAVSAANAPATIALDGDKTIGNLYLRNLNQYIVAPGTGGSLILDNGGRGARIQVDSGSHVIAAPLSLADNTTIATNVTTTLSITGGVQAAAGKSLTITGPGVTSVRGGAAVDDASAITVQQSTLNADRISAGALHLSANSLVSLSPDAGTHLTSSVGTLDIAGAADNWHAKLDLNGGALIVQADAATAQQTLDTITNQIKSARTMGTWLGNGITSSAAAADNKHLTGLAVILNQKTDAGGNIVPIYTTFGGQSVDVNTILVRYSLNGDMNLDGIVNFDDYFQINTGFLSNGKLGGYRWGDLNFDGLINFDDYFLINSAFLGQGAGLPAPALAPQVIPEPASALLLLAGACAMLRRRVRAS